MALLREVAGVFTTAGQLVISLELLVVAVRKLRGQIKANSNRDRAMGANAVLLRQGGSEKDPSFALQERVAGFSQDFRSAFRRAAAGLVMGSNKCWRSAECGSALADVGRTNEDRSPFELR
jgi:hypothetical protein